MRLLKDLSLMFVAFAFTLIVLLSGCSTTQDEQKLFIATEQNKTTAKMITRHGELVVPPFLLEEYKQNTNNATTAK